MASMLDQAVIDATALKEAALKNAEQLVLERYAPQIKEVVDSLLEQEDEEDPLADLGGEDPLAGDMGMGAGGPPSEDPLAQGLTLAATDGTSTCPCPDEEEEIEIDFDQLAQMSGGDTATGLPGQMDSLAPTEDEMFMEEDGGGVEIPAQLGPELHMYHMSMGDPVYKVGSLAYAGKPVPRDLVESAIQSLEKLSGKMQDPSEEQQLEQLIMQLQQALGSTGAEPEMGQEPGGEPVMENCSDDEMYEGISDDLQTEEIDELLENVMAELNSGKYEKEEPSQKPSAAIHKSTSDGKKYIGRAFKGQSDSEREKTMKRSMHTMKEDDSEELEESLEVEMNVVPHGHAGHANNAERIEAGQMQLAAAQDTHVAEEAKELKKALERLQQENQSLKTQVNSLVLENKNVKGIALQVSEKLEELNVQNAQLIYKNRALDSDSLNERQKKQIVEAVSKVDSVKEAKVVFESLNKSFTTKEDKKPLPKSLNEAIQKSNGIAFKTRETTERINPAKERMQKLAGITKLS